MSTTLLDLNDDCLREVFKRFNAVADQVKLARTCRRFEALIVRAWEKRYKNGATLNLNTLDLEAEDVSYLIGSIRDLVQSIAVHNEFFADQEKAEVLARDLHFWRIISIIKDCRNLEVLKMDGVPTPIADRSPARYLPKNGTIDVAFNLKQQHKLALKNEWNSLHGILRLRRLDVLTMNCMKSYFIERIIQLFGNRLYHFEVKGLFTVDLANAVLRMSALNILKIHSTGGWRHIAECLHTLTEVREIGLKGCHDLTNDDLLKFVRNCRKLAVLEVEGCEKLTAALIWQAGEILLKRNSGVRLHILIGPPNPIIDIDRHPDCIRFKSVLELTQKPMRARGLGDLRDLQLALGSIESPFYITLKFFECSDEEYDLLCRRLDRFKV